MKRDRPYVTREVVVYPSGKARMTGKRRKTTALAVPLSYQRIVGKAEKKFFDTSIVNVADVSAGAVLNSLCLVPQGTTDQTRVGNKITLKNINLRGFASNDDAAAGTLQPGILRVILFVDKQANGATATVTDILQSASISSFRNMDQVDRFVILKDQFYKTVVTVTNSTGTPHSDQGNTLWKMSVKCNIDVHFSSTTGAITELKSNNVGLLYVTDQTTCNAATLGTARVKFIDL